MSDRLVPNSVVDREADPLDWQEVTRPVVGVRSLAMVALLVPLLLAAGVFWLHRVPLGTSSHVTDNVIDVHLIGPQDASAPPQDSPQPQTSSRLETQPLVDDPDHSIPDQATEPAPPALAPLPRQAAAPASSSSVPRLSIEHDAARFQQALLSHIARYQYYPEKARLDREHGTVRLMFSMLRDGTVTDVRIMSSSGYGILDLAAVETIRKAAPMPRIPAELPEPLDLEFPMAFGLSEAIHR